MFVDSELQPIPSPEIIRNVTTEVLNRPEFSGPSAWDKFLLSLMKTIEEWLGGFVSWTAKNPGLARAMAIVMIVLLLACLAYLLYLALGDVLVLRRKKAPPRARPARWDILEGTAKNWREALALARRMLKEGDCRRAVWITHRVLLGLLDEEGAIRFAGWKTNSQYLRECTRNHPSYSVLAELTDIYEQVIYAHRQAVSSAVEALFLRVDRLCEEHTD